MFVRLVLRGTLAASAALAAVFATTGPAGAASGWVIRNDFTGAVLDARGQGTGNWTEIWAYGSNGQDNQKWSLHQVSSGVYNIQGVQSGRCIDIAHSDTAGPGANLVLWDCNSNASQKWIAENQGNGHYKLRNSLNTAWCMEAPARDYNVKINWCGSGPQTFTWSWS
ncbi:RICIN domain-containing protein [Streptomyces tsukubensis]|uniref:RICIN domain-containing protein n=1 Tax=Streptomyces tsukubensis TaxID=83656 RepID=UPI00344CBA89